MSIGEDVKAIITKNNTILKKIRLEFANALNDIREQGVEVQNSGNPNNPNLTALIGGYKVDITIQEVIKKLKTPVGTYLENVQDIAIQNIINDLIKEQLRL